MCVATNPFKRIIFTGILDVPQAEVLSPAADNKTKQNSDHSLPVSAQAEKERNTNNPYSSAYSSAYRSAIVYWKTRSRGKER